MRLSMRKDPLTSERQISVGAVNEQKQIHFFRLLE